VVDAGLSAPAHERARARALGFLSLFTSAGTLVCCALPSLFVLVGLGAAVASLLSAAPWLVTLSQHKGWVFAGAGLLIALNVAYVYGLTPRLRAAHHTCPSDAAAASCGPAERLTRVMLWTSAALYSLGVITAYGLGWLLT
jgi:hypothetical protein